MTPRSQNIAVGLTVLVALAMLGGMILLFAGMPGIFRGGYQLTVLSNASGGVAEGTAVIMSGMRVGEVTSVAFTDNDPSKGVTITVHINKGHRIPVGTTGYVIHGVVGGSTLELRIEKDPLLRNGEFLPTDGTATIDGVAMGATLIDELRPAVNSLSKLTDSINELVSAPPEDESATGPATSTGPATTRRTGIQTTLAKLNRTLDSINKVIGDPQNQQNLRVTIEQTRKFMTEANRTLEVIREVATRAGETAESMNNATTRVSDDFHALTMKLIDDAEAISRAMSSLDKMLVKIESGQGTTGKLINDPKLYNNLVDVTDQLNSLMKDFRELSKQWKDKGMNIRMK